jgi:transposase
MAEDSSFTFERDIDKIMHSANRCGYFCILSNKSLNSNDILSIYRRKDIIEKNFDDIKNYIGMKRLRTHNSYTTDGKLFCAFISLIITSEIKLKCREFMKKNSWSKKNLINEMEKIRVIRKDNGYRLMNPVTKTQRIILDLFGLSEEDLESYVNGKTSHSAPL